MQNQEFDSVFKNKLESFEMPPDDASWDAINQQMNKKRWLKRTAYFSALVILVGLLSQLFTKEEKTKEKQTIDSVQTNPTEAPSSEDITIPIQGHSINDKQNPISTSSSSTSIQTPSKETTTVEQTPTPISPTKDSVITTTATTTPKADTVATPKVVVVKKKKPVYIIQQDTIVKTDTVQVKKRTK